MNYFYCKPEENICADKDYAGPQYPQCLDIAPNPDKLRLSLVWQSELWMKLSHLTCFLCFFSG